MSLLELFLIGIGLSMDAFAVAICQGLSMPKLNLRRGAVIALFYGVSRWNDYWSALMYVTDRSLFPLALVLRNILMMNEQMTVSTEFISSGQAEYIAMQSYMVEGMKYALIFISALPMLIAYPFVQKHFTKGVMIGALKG